MRRAGTGMFGWCIDDLHDKCMVWFTNSDRRCSCDCHNNKEKVMDSTSVEEYPHVIVPSWTPTVQPEPAPVVSETPAPAPTTSTTTKVDSRAIRAWAKAQGIEVGARGRIKPEVIARYNDAHGA